MKVLALTFMILVVVIVNVSCGGSSGSNNCTLSNIDCNIDQYCHFPETTCGRDEISGTCETRPEICTADFQPVCGCDGNSYANQCNAASAGVSVLSEGQCRTL